MPTSFERVRDLLDPLRVVAVPVTPVLLVQSRLDVTRRRVQALVSEGPDALLAMDAGLLAQAVELVDPSDPTASDAMSLIDQKVFAIRERRGNPPRLLGLHSPR
jgi:hypothetical protein